MVNIAGHLDQIRQPSSLLAMPSHHKGKSSSLCFYLKLTKKPLPPKANQPIARPAPRPARSARVRARPPRYGKEEGKLKVSSLFFYLTILFIYSIYRFLLNPPPLTPP